MNLKISKWCGRLGNNILQLKNAIQVALFYNCNIIIPNHEYFTTNYIIVDSTINKNNSIKITHDFFNFELINNIDRNLFNINMDKTIDILKQIFRIKNVSPLHDNDLVIHIRSGDIFKQKPHQSYIMPPLSYYTNIINNNNFNNITIIAECKSNPCINKLLALYPKIKFIKQSLDRDIKLLLASANVIESFGSFVPALLLVSNNIKNLYKPSYQVNFFGATSYKINIHETDLNHYKNLLSPWQNTKKQINIMLTYGYQGSHNVKVVDKPNRHFKPRVKRILRRWSVYRQFSRQPNYTQLIHRNVIYNKVKPLKRPISKILFL